MKINVGWPTVFQALSLMLSHKIYYVFLTVNKDKHYPSPPIFFFFFNYTHGTWKFLGQRPNLSHSCNPHCSSLTHLARLEIKPSPQHPAKTLQRQYQILHSLHHSRSSPLILYSYFSHAIYEIISKS